MTPTQSSRYTILNVFHTWLVKGTIFAFFSSRTLPFSLLFSPLHFEIGNTFIGFAKGAPELYLGRAANVTVVGNSYINNGGMPIPFYLSPPLLLSLPLFSFAFLYTHRSPGPYINPHSRFFPNPSINDCEYGGPYGPYNKTAHFFGIGYNIKFLNNNMYPSFCLHLPLISPSSACSLFLACMQYFSFIF